MGQHHPPHRRAALRGPGRFVAVAALAAASLSSSARACDTPVFRFAMYSPQWAPWPYTVYHLRGGGEVAEDVGRANGRLEAAARDEEGAPNLQGQDGPRTDAPSPAYVSDFLATSEGLALTKAFMKIKVPKLRRRIVDLVEEIAGEDDD